MIHARPGGGDCAFAGLSGSTTERDAHQRSDGFTALPILNGGRSESREVLLLRRGISAGRATYMGGE
jgi:hypothetical protein